MERYPDSIRLAVNDLIRSGTSADELKKLYGIGRGTAYSWLRALQAGGESVSFRHAHEGLKEAAFARFRSGASVQDLVEDLGVSRAQLYRWLDEFRSEYPSDPPPATGSERLSAGSAGKSVSKKSSGNCGKDLLIMQLESALAQKTLEADFFRGALREVEARRRQTTESGENRSTQE